MGDNGKELNQDQNKQPENNQPAYSIAGTPMADPSNRVVMTIYLDINGKPHVYGMLKEKELCLNILADAIKIVASLKPSPIIQAPAPLGGFRRFLNQGKGRVG